MAFELDFGNLFGGNTTTGLNALLNADQRRLMNQQGNLSAAAALLAASGPSRQRVGLGQALGSALQAGQQGYQQARAGSLQELMLGAKLQDMQTERARQAAFTSLLGGGQTTGLNAAQASLAAPVETAGPVGPTQTRAALMNAAPQPQAGGPLSFLNPTQRALLGGMKPEQGLPEILKLSQASEEYGAPTPVVMNGRTVMVQYNKMGQPRIAQGAMPYEAQSPDIRAVEYISGQPLAGTGPAGITQVGQYRQQIAPKTDVKVNVPVDMTGGQKGFENEMALGSKFKAEPIYKDFNDMKSAFGQVVSSLSAGTPIGDVAGATKIMKLLDPGSVVRESELAIAMQASGRMDRLQNYFNNFMTGQKLTPTQRDDFQALANELYSAAGQAYNQKRAEYDQFGQAYGFRNLNTALGPAANIPSLARRPALTTGGPQRPRRDLNDIFLGGPQ
jgi:hypothetical protein